MMAHPILTEDVLTGLKAELARTDRRSFALIADELGMTKSALIGALRRRGIEAVHPPAIVDAAFLGSPARARTKAKTPTPPRSNLRPTHGVARMAPKPRVRAADRLAEMRKLADEAIAAGRITVLKPGYAAFSQNMCWERIL